MEMSGQTHTLADLPLRETAPFTQQTEGFVGPHRQPGHFEEKKNLLPLATIEPWAVPACSLSAILTELSWFLTQLYV